MKTFGIKLALAALAVTALVASPAFARTHRLVNQDNGAANYRAAPGSEIPGYSADGSVVGVANPDWYGARSQR